MYLLYSTSGVADALSCDRKSAFVEFEMEELLVSNVLMCTQNSAGSKRGNIIKRWAMGSSMQGGDRS